MPQSTMQSSVPDLGCKPLPQHPASDCLRAVKQPIGLKLLAHSLVWIWVLPVDRGKIAMRQSRRLWP